MPGEKPKILIVDENEENINRLSEILREGDYDLRSALSKGEALDFLQKWKPDLMILSVFIRRFDPLSFLSEIRENPFLSNQKILILSQNPKIGEVIGPAPKVKGYISKPPDLEKLKNLLLEIIPRPPGRKKIKIMVVDDDEEFAELLRMFLISNEYESAVITDSSRAVESVKREMPDALLLDINMPGKDGFQIMDELQDERETAEIPIIVISALSFDRYAEKGALTGLPEIIYREYPKDIILETVARYFSGPVSGERKEGKEIKPCVLLADDQTELLFLMKEQLENEGFRVVTAIDGNETMQMVFEYHPDIAVLDYNMPFKDGLTIARELKDNPLFAHIPIIIVTGEGKRDVKIKGLSMGIDDYLIKPVDIEELIARIRMILKRNKQVLDTNPLSKLPGNPSIQARIEREIAQNRKFAVLYLDLNNFKAYNDAYGFEAGDFVIKSTANLLVKLTMQNENSDDFIGHIGGDDFIIVTSFERAEDLCRRITAAFDEIAPSFYNERDRKAGHIISTDRQGQLRKFPFLSISIGVVHNNIRPLTSFAQISNIGAELKKVAKADEKSSYFFDRRKD